MKFTCEKVLLESALSPLSRVVSTKSTLPILENILFDVSADGVRLAATDLEIGMKTLVPAKVEESGTTTIPARIFYDVVTRLEEGTIEIALDPEQSIVLMNGEGFKYKFNVIPSDGYPVLPETPKDFSFSISQEELKKILRDTMFAASSPREDNPVLSGLLMKVEKDFLTVVGLDGYRLSRRSAKISKNPMVRSVIVPARAFMELGKILKDSEDPVEIYLGEHQVVFKVADVIFFSRLLEGQFPQYEQIIPKQSDSTVKVKKEVLLQALRRASILAQDRESPRLIKMHLLGNALTITANTQDLGQAYEEINVTPAKGSEKADVTVAFNARYLIDALTVIDDENVKLEMGQSTSPGVIRPESGDQFIYVVMPVRTVGELVAA